MLRNLSRRSALVCALALTLSMCTTEGTETDNPVLDFDATECKSHSTALTLATVARTSAALAVDPSNYDGLYCYAWEAHDDGSLTIDVLNYLSGCSIVWQLGESRVSGDQVDLGISISRCAIAGCGSCVYDLTFELEAIDLDAPADVQLRRLGCDGSEDELEPRVTLPIDASASGIRCRPLPSYGFEEKCGGVHEPPCTGGCESGCDDGLACAHDEILDHDSCFAACEADADCPLDIESCRDGACRLRDTF